MCSSLFSVLLILFTVVRMSSPSPAALEETNCNSCGRLIAYAPCKSDRNGNKGRMVAMVCYLTICLEIYALTICMLCPFTVPSCQLKWHSLQLCAMATRSHQIAIPDSCKCSYYCRRTTYISRACHRRSCRPTQSKEWVMPCWWLWSISACYRLSTQALSQTLYREGWLQLQEAQSSWNSCYACSPSSSGCQCHSPCTNHTPSASASAPTRFHSSHQRVGCKATSLHHFASSPYLHRTASSRIWATWEEANGGCGAPCQCKEGKGEGDCICLGCSGWSASCPCCSRWLFLAISWPIHAASDSCGPWSRTGATGPPNVWWWGVGDVDGCGCWLHYCSQGGSSHLPSRLRGCTSNWLSSPAKHACAGRYPQHSESASRTSGCSRGLQVTWPVIVYPNTSIPSINLLCDT